MPTVSMDLQSLDGVVTHRPDVASAVERHFDGLIQHGHLRRLALDG